MAMPSMLGSYPVERELGRGGMGVVYLGRDPRLNRLVAIKVLPDALARDAESLARFDREAKLLASLNDPHIAAIHGIEEVDQQQLLVLEYVPGDTLAARLAQGPLTIDEALDVCRQIALAVESAHDGGVIHRDLKPGNIKITPNGQVKVLDFGLAKGAPATSNPDLALSPTITVSPTAAGVVLGTAGYMSPEQARGKPLDRRTDIWSFGCVLFECLSRHQAFAAETVSDAIGKILERDPDWSLLPAATPPRIRELLRRCLEKDVRKRQRDIGDARIDIEEAITERASGARVSGVPAAATTRSWSTGWERKAAWTGLLAVAAAAGFAAWTAIRGPTQGGPEKGGGPVRLSVAIPPGIRAVHAGLTRDGSAVLLAGRVARADGTYEPRGRMYIRRLDQYEFTPMPGSDGAEAFVQSTDGRWLAVLIAADEASPRRLVKVRVDGTMPPATMAVWDGQWQPNAAWLPDGDMLVLTGGSTQFVRLPATGGPPGPPIKFDFGSATTFATFQEPLPDGRHVLMTLATWNDRGYSEDVWVVEAATGKGQRLLENAGATYVSPTGHLVFSRGEALMAAPFDVARRAITGEVTPLVDGLRTSTWGHGAFELANNGTLIYAPGGRLGVDRRIVTVDAAGAVSAFSPERRPFEHSLSASPDGRRAAVTVPGARGTYEIWLAERDRPGLRRVVAMTNADSTTPIWSPDGQRLAFSRIARDNADGIYVQSVDGRTAAQPIVKIESPKESFFPIAWAPDGRGVLFDRLVGDKRDILLLPVSASGEPGSPRPLRATPGGEASARFSPNGRLVAFVTDESGQFEAYVAAYDADGTIGPPVLVSSGGGYVPMWSADGRRIFYADRHRRVRSVTVHTSPTLSIAAPTTLYDLVKLRLRTESWDILGDGRLLAIQQGEGEDEVTSYNVVVNWTSELLARMGPRAR
jgi:serine/threonine-protein kinase